MLLLWYQCRKSVSMLGVYIVQNQNVHIPVWAQRQRACQREELTWHRRAQAHWHSRSHMQWNAAFIRQSRPAARTACCGQSRFQSNWRIRFWSFYLNWYRSINIHTKQLVKCGVIERITWFLFFSFFFVLFCFWIFEEIPDLDGYKTGSQ